MIFLYTLLQVFPEDSKVMIKNMTYLEGPLFYCEINWKRQVSIEVKKWKSAKKVI